ncbi:MAG: hypothetical protein JSV95_07870 [Gemmatimonadota bacterium]|nr:MAG: hypothetical protein JSV95_07870 [Gemmatimonadota bacterium]
MSAAGIPLPPRAARVFRSTVHGLPFGGRMRHLPRIRSGEPLVLVPDPPGAGMETVWVHLLAGDVVGHLPNEIGSWLGPWMRRGGQTRVRLLRVGDESVPSWKRLLVEVTCG